MDPIRRLLTVLLLAAGGMILAQAADLPENWDGLVRVKPKRLDAAYLLPGADFRPFNQVLIQPPEIAFQKDWLKNYNRSAPGSGQDLSEADLQRIAETARQEFGEVFAEAFSKAGLGVVTAPGPGVLRLSTAVIDLYISAPDTMSAGRSRTFTMEAGEATLILEARDSVTGTLLGRAMDRRETQTSGRMQITNRVTNLSDFRQLFRRWADICVKGLQELQAQSPVPENLAPQQKL